MVSPVPDVWRSLQRSRPSLHVRFGQACVPTRCAGVAAVSYFERTFPDVTGSEDGGRGNCAEWLLSVTTKAPCLPATGPLSVHELSWSACFAAKKAVMRRLSSPSLMGLVGEHPCHASSLPLAHNGSLGNRSFRPCGSS